MADPSAAPAAKKGPQAEHPAPAAPVAPLDVLEAVPVSGVTLSNPTNPVVFLDVSIDGAAAGRVKIELYADKAPRTAENFRQLCTGATKRNGLPAGYKDAPILRVVPNLVVQGGDFVRRDGTGTFSIYGDVFTDEPAALALSHDRPGVVSMANAGKDRNGCQFMVTLQPATSLDGKHAVVGQVVAGMDVLHKLEGVALRGDRPIPPVVISMCGQL